MIPPKHLVLSGGGIKVSAIVGALLVLEKKGLLRNVKEICGVSAGAFLGFLMATGYPLKKIENLVLELNFSVIRNLTPEAILEFPERFGLDNGANFIKFLESIFRVVLKIDPGLTFRDFSLLHKEGQRQFRCWATDLKTLGTREFSLKETPGVRIIDALRASMALPFYFTPPLDPVTGNMLSDGGIQGNIPLHHLTEDECESSFSVAFSRGKKEDTNPKDFMGYVNSILSCLTHSRNDECLKKWDHKILKISVDEYPSWNFEASRDDRTALLNKGRESALEWCKNSMVGSRVISRRVSI
jgi:predicted acylesterase/phospholipase RssA